MIYYMGLLCFTFFWNAKTFWKARVSCRVHSRATFSCPSISPFSTYYMWSRLIIDSKILMLKNEQKYSLPLCILLVCIKHILIKRNYQCHIIRKQIIITETWRSIQRLEDVGDEDRRNNRNMHEGCWCIL